jgi:glycosyltransferase involved in cell wall biosynthesis
MKILLVSFLYETEIGGGAAVVLNQLAQMLIRQNHDVVVLTTWAGFQVKTENMNGLKIIRLPASNLYWVADKDRQPAYKKVFWQLIDIWNPLIYRLAREIFIKETPDIVHSHKLRGLSPSIWSAATSVGVKKIVHTCHDYELLSPEGYFMGWAGRLAQEQNLAMRPYQNLRKYFSQQVHVVTAPSRFVLDMHKKMGFFSKAKTRIIPNTHGFDVGELRQKILVLSSLHKKDLARYFLYLGRLDKAKGVDLLCQAFLQVAGQKQDHLLKIAGWGPLDESLREKYKHQKNIIFLGPVFGTPKTALFWDSDVLLAPSLSPEPFGIVIVEAYAHGLPVITSQAGAFPEIVRDGETGILVRTGSVEELSSAILRFCTEKNLSTTMSENCFEEAHKFTTDKFFDGYFNIYKGKE